MEFFSGRENDNKPCFDLKGITHKKTPFLEDIMCLHKKGYLNEFLQKKLVDCLPKEVQQLAFYTVFTQNTAKEAFLRQAFFAKQALPEDEQSFSSEISALRLFLESHLQTLPSKQIYSVLARIDFLFRQEIQPIFVEKDAYYITLAYIYVHLAQRGDASFKMNDLIDEIRQCVSPERRFAVMCHLLRGDFYKHPKESAVQAQIWLDSFMEKGFLHDFSAWIHEDDQKMVYNQLYVVPLVTLAFLASYNDETKIKACLNDWHTNDVFAVVAKNSFFDADLRVQLALLEQKKDDFLAFVVKMPFLQQVLHWEDAVLLFPELKSVFLHSIWDFLTPFMNDQLFDFILRLEKKHIPDNFLEHAPIPDFARRVFRIFLDLMQQDSGFFPLFLRKRKKVYKKEQKRALLDGFSSLENVWHFSDRKEEALFLEQFFMAENVCEYDFDSTEFLPKNDIFLGKEYLARNVLLKHLALRWEHEKNVYFVPDVLDGVKNGVVLALGLVTNDEYEAGGLLFLPFYGKLLVLGVNRRPLPEELQVLQAKYARNVALNEIEDDIFVLLCPQNVAVMDFDLGKFADTVKEQVLRGKMQEVIQSEYISKLGFRSISGEGHAVCVYTEKKPLTQFLFEETALEITAGAFMHPLDFDSWSLRFYGFEKETCLACIRSYLPLSDFCFAEAVDVGGVFFQHPNDVRQFELLFERLLHECVQKNVKYATFITHSAMITLLKKNAYLNESSFSFTEVLRPEINDIVAFRKNLYTDLVDVLQKKEYPLEIAEQDAKRIVNLYTSGRTKMVVIGF